MERSYTVSEIDGLRRVIRDKIIWGKYSGPTEGNCSSWGYRETEVAAKVESMVITHMMAGHTHLDLLNSEEDSLAALRKATGEPA